MRRNLSVVFHPDYTVSLPPGHRFPIGKFGKIRELLLKDCVVSSDSFINPQPVTRLELSLAHSKNYIDRILSLSLERGASYRPASFTRTCSPRLCGGRWDNNDSSLGFR